MSKTEFFKYGFHSAALVDVGRMRNSNQDAVITCPEQGFFAVCDGMGGLSDGGKTSELISRVLPGIIIHEAGKLLHEPNPHTAEEILKRVVKKISNSIYDTANRERVSFGATLTGVWLVDEHAVFVNLGDSRGYILPRYKKQIKQITQDHNIAAILVKQGEITKDEARSHSSSSRLTRFMGMPHPAMPEVFIERIMPGDRLLLCSDGLHGMVEGWQLRRLMRSSRSPECVCKNLIGKANENGGRDNISAVFIRITKYR